MTATTTTSTNAVSLDDLTAWNAILALQVKYGAASPTLDDAACAAFARWLLMFMSNKRAYWDTGTNRWALADNTALCLLITNMDIQDWLERLDTQLALHLSVPAYGVPYSKTFAAWLWSLVTQTGVQIGDFLGNWPLGYTPGGGSGGEARFGSFEMGVHSAYASWGTATPPFTPPQNLQVLVDSNAASWSNASGLKSALSVLWTSQVNTLKTLVPLSELTPDQCLFLMYLLPCLVTGNGAQQNSVTKIASASCTSIELFDSDLYTSLVYYNLMRLADPVGPYAQINSQIQDFINNLIPMVTGTDVGSVFMKGVLTKQAKILLVTAGYPMVDPYCPGIDFNTRQADLLEAINMTWAQLQSL